MKQNEVYYLIDAAGASIFLGSLFDCMILFFSLMNEKIFTRIIEA